jgi:thiol-disulfide isomerase/thioredoxin
MRTTLRADSVKPLGLALAALALLVAGPLAVLGPTAAPADTPEMKVVQPEDVHALIAANKGKVVFLNFFATYCVPCHTEFPDIIKMSKKYQNAGVQVVEVSMNDNSDPSDKGAMLKWLDEVKPPFPVYIASSLDDEFYKGVSPQWAKDGEGLPMTMIFDRDGKMAHYYQKALTLADMEHDVTPLLAASSPK